MTDNTIVKFLPCDPVDTVGLEEWLDALSMEGYLVRYESINSIYARFYKAEEAKRYYHLLIPTIKTQSRGLISDEDREITSETIMQYKESGMEYLGETGGCMLFRTDQLSVIRKCCDICGYFDVKKSISYKTVSMIIMLIPLFSLSNMIFRAGSFEAISMQVKILLSIEIILVLSDIIIYVIDIIQQRHTIKKEDKLLPTYLKDVKIRSAFPRMFILISMIIVLVLLTIVYIIESQKLS